MGPRQYTIVIALLLALALSPYGASVGPGHASILKTPSSWTIMVYMADNYTPDLPWRDNINQMEAAQQAPGTNIIVLVHPLGSNISELLRIEHDNGTHGDAIISSPVNDSGAVIPSNGTVDMGSPATLRSFIRFVATNYVADHLVLIMWGHAGGWFGLCPDGNDILTLPEFREALAGAVSDIGRTLDLIGIDSCGEATIETLYEVHPYSSYLVASEKNIPDEGLPYTPILDRLASNPAQTNATFASGIAQDYIDWSRYNSSISASMGVFNLSKVGDLKTSLDALARTGTKYEGLFHQTLNDTFASAQNYTERWNCDFGDLMGRLLDAPLPPDVHKAAMDTILSYLAVRTDFQRLEIPNPLDGEHVARATGAVIYAPTIVWPDESYADLQIANESGWYLFSRLARQEGPTNSSTQVPVWAYNYENGQPTSVTLKWPGGCDSNDVAVFIDEVGGLSYINSTFERGNLMTIQGEGHLTISANAINGTIAQAHATISVTLYGHTKINVQIIENGRNSTRVLEIRVTGKKLISDNMTRSGSLHLNLTVPSQAEIGDTLLIEAVDQRSGAVLGEALAIADEDGTTVTIDIHHSPERGLPQYVSIFLALLPGSLILLFALQLYLGDKKKRRNTAR